MTHPPLCTLGVDAVLNLYLRSRTQIGCPMPVLLEFGLSQARRVCIVFWLPVMSNEPMAHQLGLQYDSSNARVMAVDDSSGYIMIVN